jgi:hypothetical protein
MKKNLTIFFLLIFGLQYSQNVKDSLIGMNLVVMQFSGQVPEGDLKDRFGTNMSAGLSYLRKTKKNWLFGAEGDFFFTKKVKEDVLASLRTPDNGSITNTDGNFSSLRLMERGWNITLSVGKIIPIKKISNVNSGICIMVGPGYMRHKVNIYDVAKKVPQVSGDYKKGYDRLTAGASIKEFIGYIFLSNSRMVNFYGGFEFYQGFTQSVRTYDNDLMKADTKKRLDLLVGIRLGWILPFYKRQESSNLFP